MRVGIEATSLMGPRSGVGHTTSSLVEAMVASDPDLEVVLLPLSARGRLRAPSHPRVRAVRARIPARLAGGVWSRASWPPAELFCGPVDVFHAPNFLLPPVLKAAAVMTIHDLAFVKVPQDCSPHVLGYARTVPAMAERSQRIVVPSRFVEAELAGWLPAVADRVRVVPWGIRDVFLQPGGPLTATRRRELGLRDPYVLYLGNLETRKGLASLLRAWRTLTGVQLVLCGARGPGFEQLDTSGAVVTGYLPDAEAAALMRGAAAFVYPSRYEGFGIPPLEAMACGTPVVAAKAGPLPEVLGDHPRWVAPDDADELAAALLDVVEHPPSLRELAAARDHARSYSFKRTAVQTLAVYREAIRA